jgi:hypothetical protein
MIVGSGNERKGLAKSGNYSLMPNVRYLNLSED